MSRVVDNAREMVQVYAQLPPWLAPGSACEVQYLHGNEHGPVLCLAPLAARDMRTRSGWAIKYECSAPVGRVIAVGYEHDDVAESELCAMDVAMRSRQLTSAVAYNALRHNVRAAALALTRELSVQAGQWVVVTTALMQDTLAMTAPRMLCVVLAPELWRLDGAWVVQVSDVETVSTRLDQHKCAPTEYNAILQLLDESTEAMAQHNTDVVLARTWSRRGLYHRLLHLATVCDE